MENQPIQQEYRIWRTIDKAILIVIGVLVSLIGIVGILNTLMVFSNIFQFLPFSGLGLTTLPVAIGLFILGIDLITVFAIYPYAKYPRWLRLVRYIGLIIPAGIGLYFVGKFVYFSHFNPLNIVLISFPQIPEHFLAALNLCIASFALSTFCFKSHSQSAMVYFVGLPAFLILNLSIYALVGYVYNIPVLYSFGMSFSTCIGFIFLGGALLFGTIPFKGILYPLISDFLPSRIAAISSIIVGYCVIFIGIYAIAHFESFNPTKIINGYLDFAQKRFYVGFELITVFLAIIVKTASLQAIRNFDASTFYFKKQAQTAKREAVIRRIIQTVRSSLNLEEILQKIVDELGRLLQADYCLISCLDPECLRIIFPVREYRSLKMIPSLLQSEKFLSKESIKTICEQGVISEWKESDTENSPLSTETQEAFSQLQVQSGLACPVSYQGKHLALLFVISMKKGKEYWTREEKEIVQTIADQAAVAIHQAELFKASEKAKQDAEIANAKKSKFLTFMSHEFKTPLNSIIGYSEMLESGYGGDLTQKQQKYIQNVRVSGGHLLTIVNDLLDIASIEAGKIQLSPELIELQYFIQDLNSVVAQLASEKNIFIKFEVQPSLATVKADAKRLRQILLNLLSNAIKYNHNGGKVVVAIEETSDQQWVHFRVEDTGVGIPQDKLSQLFTEYYQVESGIPQKYESSGLGLAITKRLVEAHGGTISVESEEGVGSVFTVKLPKNPVFKPALRPTLSSQAETM